ncbi:MAG: TRAP transporter TatT component family protein [Treponema sp.]|nr:TRAP transporter TatT component family protein [Treponema sp.]
MNLVADALTGEGGTDVFTGDNDPQLVGDAIPFAIKMYESLLAGNPTHQGLVFTTGSLFVMYANAFIQGPAEMLPHNDWQAREAAMNRAKNMYLRGYNILYDGLEAKYSGFRQGIANEGTRQSFLNKIKKDDVGFLYWTVAGGLSAFSIDIMDFELSARIPEWNAMIHRAYELDPDFGGCALDEFFIIFYASLPDTLGGDPEKAQVHFQRAIEKSKGTSTSAYLSYAQSICIPAQDYDTFEENLKKALAINPDDDVSSRLVNIINQRKAKWLLDNAWQFFSFLPIPDDF